jgi:hypothetical protein
MSEEIKKISVSEMLRTTGTNTADFMAQVATHVEKLEDAVKQLQARVAELELQNDLGVVATKP